MLARAARRRLRRDAFRHSTPQLEQLTLPWLCPAQMRWAASVGEAAVARSNAARKQTHAPSTTPRTESRPLSTLVQSSPFSQVPPDALQSLMQSWTPQTTSPNVSRLETWDPSKPLIVHSSLASATPKLNFQWGVGGDPAELHQNLHACLRVGRMDRAAAIVRRLTDIYHPSASEVVNAHNAYLEGLLEAADSSEAPMQDIEDWYNKEMINKTVEPNAQTCVHLLRASMAFLDDPERGDSVRKYLNLARDLGDETFEEVNSSPDFDEEEWDMLIRFQPDVFEEPSEVDEQADIQLSTPDGEAIAMEHGLISDSSLKVKSVSQKGLGLKTLQKALETLDQIDALPFPDDPSSSVEGNDRANAYLRQLRLEKTSLEAAVARWRAEDTKMQEMGIHGVLKTKSVQGLMWQWYSALLPLIQEEFKAIKDSMAQKTPGNKSDDRHVYGPYMELTTPQTLTALTVQCAVQVSLKTKLEKDTIPQLKISRITTQLGQHIEEEVNAGIAGKAAASLNQHRVHARKRMLSKLSKGPFKFKASKNWTKTGHPTLEQLKQKEIPRHIKARIGALLVSKLLKSAKITITRVDPQTGKTLTSSQPAWSHYFSYHQGKKVGFLKVHYELERKLRQDPIKGVTTMRLPMLVEPKPWTGYKNGAYCTYDEAVVRCKNGDEAQQAYAVSAISKGDMSKMLAGLDVLGKVPWKINKEVFQVMTQAWNAGEGIAKLIPEELDLERPLEPGTDAPWLERQKWKKKLQEYENEKSGLHSQKCFQNFQLEVARAYLDKKFYFPHNVDFRGRAYPIPPVLNHMGADIARGLLQFGRGKELGSVGLQWLKIHMANLYGYDKASLKDREQFSTDNLDDIYDSAMNPLDGRRWWSKAEDPWQCLACCIELKNALESPDPTRFVSHLPVHQDGTCNGLQHYAALGGDRAGATQVNLEPADKPQDIYTGVAELVKEEITKDAKQGNRAAKLLQDKITRKVVKRTVMTNVYGVTFIGAKLQVLDELKDIFPDFKETEEVPTLSFAAVYIARKIFVALGKIFNGAQDIQYWLGECASRITTSLTAEQCQQIEAHMNGDHIQPYDSKYKKPTNERSMKMQAKIKEELFGFKSSVIWTTPLKMPVVQPYRTTKMQLVRTALQTVSISNPKTSDVVSKRKQLQAFPPNFIHSLDATHMLLSALKCDEMGLSFAAVHDSFWTHAADVPNLNVILRDAFINMHSEDIVGRLAAEFKARYSGSLYRAVVDICTPAGRQILQWREKQYGKQQRFASPPSEIALEAKRVRLLDSANPEERKEGQEMVTPASIYESMKGEQITETADMPIMLGATSSNSPKNIIARNKEAAKDVETSDASSEIKIEPDDLVTVSEEEIKMLKEKNELPELTEETKLNVEEQGEATVTIPEPRKTRAKRSEYKRIQVWLPLTFPPVPKKGDWDVTRLKESKYFFS